MRITTGMTDRASVDAGISMAGNSLVNYLNGNESNSLANSLGEKHHSRATAWSKGKYDMMKEAAENLEKQADRMNETGSGSIYEKAKESGDFSEVQNEVKKLVNSFNSMLDKLRTDMTTMGRFYQQSLKEAAMENKDVLKGIGISLDKNGRMNIDYEKLKSADIDRVESVFGAAGTLSSKLNLIAGKVLESAESNLKSISNQYNASGNSVDPLLRSFDAKR